jgi:hypothetical protein
MHRVFQPFINSLINSADSTDLRNVLMEAGSALDLRGFAYLALPYAGFQSLDMPAPGWPSPRAGGSGSARLRGRPGCGRGGSP